MKSFKVSDEEKSLQQLLDEEMAAEAQLNEMNKNI